MWRAQIKLAKFWAMAFALMTLATATNVFAQVKKFEGVSFYSSTGYETWSLDASNYTGYSNIRWDTWKPSAVPLNIGLDYTWALGEKNTLGIALETNLLKSSTATGNQYYDGAYSGTVSIYTDSYYDISLVPGFLLSKDTLLYGRLGYFSVRVVTDDPSTYLQSGYSYGIGAKTLFHTSLVDNHFYLFSELRSRLGKTITHVAGRGSSDYSIDWKANGTSVLVGVGMNF
jgi:hypothetical protein